MNYVKEYYSKLESGEIKASKEVIGIYKQMVEQMDQEDFLYYFNEEAGQYVIDFIETFCRHYKGRRFAGTKVKLQLFQKAFIQNLFGWLDKETNMRRFKEYFLEVTRKHGKSFLSACIAIYMMLADEEPGAEIYSMATKLDQAKIIYNDVRNIIDQSKTLRKRVKFTREGIEFKATRSFMKPLPNESKTLDGLNPHFVAIDELEEQRDRNAYDVLKQGMSARDQALLGCITTSGFLREGIYDSQHEYACNVALGIIIDLEFFGVVYKLDDIEEWTNEDMWEKANPGLDAIKSRKVLKGNVEKAKNDPSFLPTLLVKDFNMKQNEKQSWLPYEWTYREHKYDISELAGSYAIGGCDLSSTTDLTCATLLIKKKNDDTIYVIQKYFLPESKLDKVDKATVQEAPYRLWAEQGWLTVCSGTSVDYSEVTQWFVEMVKVYDIRPLWVCYDRALAGYWVPEMEDYGFEMEKTAQGPFTWSQPMKEMAAAFEGDKVNYNFNPMLLWCLNNTASKSQNKDGIETIQPVKIQQHRRIDGMVSLLNAWVGYVKHYDDYERYIG